MVQYKKLFQGAQSAGLRDRVVSWSPAKNIPGDGIRDAGVFQVPNIPGQLGAPAFLPVVEVRFVSSPSYFECVSCQPGIGLDMTIVVPDNPGLVDDALLSNAAEVG